MACLGRGQAVSPKNVILMLHRRLRITALGFSLQPPTVSLVLPGESPTELRARALRDRELRLRRVLERLRDKRRLMRRERVRREFPVVSVVGYTNCGEEGEVHEGGYGTWLGG